MFSRRIQQRVRHLVSLLIRPLAQSGVTPNTLTVIGLLLSIVTAVVLSQGFLLAGGLLVLFAGIFDMFDGAMARVSNTATTFGAFIDSTLDRYSESIILFGLLYYALQRPMLYAALWPFTPEQQWMIALIFIAAVGSLMVSYAKARAEGLGLECKTGLLARPERVVILAIGLLFSAFFPAALIWALALLAIFSNVTAVERIVYVWHITSRAAQTPKANQAADVHASFSGQLNQLDGHDGQRPASTENRHMATSLETNEVTDPSVRPVPSHVPPFTGGVQE
jgi:CDP-diacylglycerol---glycerol-3-phosphate 3-phosphatidyltransferase